MQTPPTPWTIQWTDDGYANFYGADGLLFGSMDVARATAELILAAINGREPMRESLHQAANRIESAAIRSGTTPEYAAAAVQPYRDLLASKGE